MDFPKAILVVNFHGYTVLLSEKQEKALLENKINDEQGQSLDIVPEVSGQKRTLSDKSIEYRYKNIDMNHDNNILNNINIIKELFEKFGINFSEKHREVVNDLLKKNSVDYLVKHFTQQYEILSNNPAVKNVPAVFSKHLFAGTCEIDTASIVEREKNIEEKKKNEAEEEKNTQNTLDIFYSLPVEKQVEIEEKILKKARNPDDLLILKRTSIYSYYKMLSLQIRKVLESENLI